MRHVMRLLRRHYGKLAAALLLAGMIYGVWWALPVRPRASWTAPRECELFSLSANGKTLVTCDRARGSALPGPIRLWDVPTGSCKLVNLTESFAAAHPSWLCASPDGSLLAVLTERPQTTYKVLHVLELGTGKLLLRREDVDLYPPPTFSADGALLAFRLARYAGTLVVWDVRAGREKLNLNDVWLYPFAFDSTGRLFASATWGYVVKVWDIESGIQLATTNNIAYPSAHGIAFDISRKKLTVVHYRDSGAFYNEEPKGWNEDYNAVKISEYDICSGGELSCNVLRNIESHMVPRTAEAGGRLFIICKAAQDRVYLVDAATSEERGELDGVAGMRRGDRWGLDDRTSVAGDILVVHGHTPPTELWERVRQWFAGENFNPAYPQSVVAFYDTTSAKKLSVLHETDDVVMSPDGRFIATYCVRDRQICVWPIPPRKPLGWFLTLAGLLLLLTLGGFWWQARRRQRQAALATETIP